MEFLTYNVYGASRDAKFRSMKGLVFSEKQTIHGEESVLHHPGFSGQGGWNRASISQVRRAIGCLC